MIRRENVSCKTQSQIPGEAMRWQGLHRHLALVMLAYSFLMLDRLTLPLPPGEAFSPLRDAKLAAWGTSTGAALAVPGSRLLAHPDRSDSNLQSSEKLTK